MLPPLLTAFLSFKNSYTVWEHLPILLRLPLSGRWSLF